MFTDAASLSVIKIISALLGRVDSYLDPDKRIIQITPIEGYHVYYYSEQAEDKYLTMKVVAWGLTEKGEVKILIIDHNNDVAPANRGGNYLGVFHKSEMDRPRINWLIKTHEKFGERQT